MVAGIKSERRPASNRNPRPECVGIRTPAKVSGMRQQAIKSGMIKDDEWVRCLAPVVDHGPEEDAEEVF